MLKIIAIIGPSGCGKTDLSFKLAKALPCSIINSDCRLVYRELDIGTAKPTSLELAQIRHYLVDIVDINEIYTVGNFKKDALEIISRINNTDDYVIICGGTGLYSSALLFNWQIPEYGPDDSLRQKLNDEMGQFGVKYIYDKLMDIDPDSALNINVNDSFRIIRALELCYLSGSKASLLRQKKEPMANVTWVGLNTNSKASLVERITKRFGHILDHGLIDEVKYLYKKYADSQVLHNTVNYKEFIPYLKGLTSLEEACNLAIANNCKLAKKQLAWHRPNNDIRWFDIDSVNNDEIAKDILDLLN